MKHSEHAARTAEMRKALA